MTLKCEWPPACEKPVVARVGLPSKNALWVCQEHFNLWQGKK